MILDWLGFILLAWLITGLITGIAEILVTPKEFMLTFCKKQKEYKEIKMYLTDDSIYSIMRLLVVLMCIAIGFVAVVHYYKVVKELKEYKIKQNS